MILLLILVLSATGICGDFTPKDHYLLYCGPYSNAGTGVSNFDGRVWSHDENSTFSSPSSFSSTITALAKYSLGSPFTAARIFDSNFTYTFPVSPGPKFLRLFFYPTLYSTGQYDASLYFMSVQANNHILLRNFSAQLAVDFIPSTVQFKTSAGQYVIKEYYLSVLEGESFLNLTFSPTPQSLYSFVNGIEIVSVPESLYITDTPLKNVDDSLSNPFEISNSSALETAYRLNVGGRDLLEISGMYRLWKGDDPYTFIFGGQPGITGFPIRYTKQVPNYTAPDLVYQTYKELGIGLLFNEKYNLTWIFKVDPGFNYMVRLHWCEDDFHVNTTADRIFDVYIDNLTAESSADVLAWTTNQRYVPVYRDYVVFLDGGDGSGGSADLWIALHPIPSTYNEVILNGMEIFKISKQDGSLDAPNPHQLPPNSNKQVPITGPPKHKGPHLVPVIVGTAAGVLMTILLACILILRRLKAKKESKSFGTSTTNKTWFIPSFKSKSTSKTTSQRGSTLPSHLCRRFSLVEMRVATNDFNEGLIVGHGGFGNVYKGMVGSENGPLPVAIKRLNVSSKQGVREFMTEIDLLSKLRHIHLVSLIGFCDESGEMILVYEFMENGTLRDHLFNNTDKPPFSWIQRLNACLGAAKGLHYLHCGASQMIIHRDVKSTNILLDDKWVSKVSDFGLSKLGPVGTDLSHVSTAVKGSIGYLDLEYYKTQRLTEKSDVYSLGVVLFEVLCGRPAVDVSLPKEQVNLAKWARGYQRKGMLDVIIDTNIKEEITPACLRKFGEIAESCVSDHGCDRPSMADVVWSLEFAIDLQEKATDSALNCHNNVLPSTINTTKAVATEEASATTTAMGTTTSDGFNFSSTSVEGRTRTNSSSALILSSTQDYDSGSIVGNVFSEILSPLGR